MKMLQLISKSYQFKMNLRKSRRASIRNYISQYRSLHFHIEWPQSEHHSLFLVNILRRNETLYSFMIRYSLQVFPFISDVKKTNS